MAIVTCRTPVHAQPVRSELGLSLLSSSSGCVRWPAPSPRVGDGLAQLAAREQRRARSGAEEFGRGRKDVVGRTPRVAIVALVALVATQRAVSF